MSYKEKKQQHDEQLAAVQAALVQTGTTTLSAKLAEQMRTYMARAQQAEHSLVLMTARAEAAEAAALEMGNEWAQAVKTSTALRERWQAAEAKLAAIPTESLTYCWYAEDSEREDDDWEHHANIVGNWMAQLRKEAQP